MKFPAESRPIARRPSARAFIHAHDFAVADIRDRVGALEDAELVLHLRVGLGRSTADLIASQIAESSSTKPEDGDAADFFPARASQLVQKSGRVEKRHRVFIVAVVVGKSRIVIRRADREPGSPRSSRGSSLPQN